MCDFIFNFSEEIYNDGLYNFTKSVIIPGIILFFTIKWSIKVAREQFEKQQEVDKIKNTKENQSILKILRETKDKLIEGMGGQIEALIKVKEKCSLDTYGNSTFLSPNNTLFTSIESFGYHRMYTLLTDSKILTSDEFFTYWEVICCTPNDLNYIKEYFNYFESMFNKRNAELNAINEKIAIECGEIVHSTFAPYVTYTFDESQAKEPKIYTSLKVQAIMDEFRVSEESHLRKISNFIDKLDELRTDTKCARVVSTRLAQNILTSKGILNSIENLFLTASSSFSGFEKKIVKSRGFLKTLSFQAKTI